MNLIVDHDRHRQRVRKNPATFQNLMGCRRNHVQPFASGLKRDLEPRGNHLTVGPEGWSLHLNRLSSLVVRP